MTFEWPSTKRIKALEAEIQKLQGEVEELRKSAPSNPQAAKVEMPRPKIRTWASFQRQIEKTVSEMPKSEVLRLLAQSTRTEA